MSELGQIADMLESASEPGLVALGYRATADWLDEVHRDIARYGRILPRQPSTRDLNSAS